MIDPVGAWFTAAGLMTGALIWIGVGLGPEIYYAYRRWRRNKKRGTMSRHDFEHLK